MGTPGSTQVVPRGHGRTRAWEELYQNTKGYPLYKAPLLCFGYFMGCLRLDAATSTSPCTSQFLLCPMSRVGIYPSVHVTFIKLLFRFGQHALVPVLQYYHCCFPSRENMGLSGLYPQNPLSLPGTSSPHWAKTPLSKHQLSHHDAWPRPECSICVGGMALTCLGSHGIPLSRSSYRSQGSSADILVLSPSQA